MKTTTTIKVIMAATVAITTNACHTSQQATSTSQETTLSKTASVVTSRHSRMMAQLSEWVINADSVRVDEITSPFIASDSTTKPTAQPMPHITRRITFYNAKAHNRTECSTITADTIVKSDTTASLSARQSTAHTQRETDAAQPGMRLTVVIAIAAATMILLILCHNRR